MLISEPAGSNVASSRATSAATGGAGDRGTSGGNLMAEARRPATGAQGGGAAAASGASRPAIPQGGSAPPPPTKSAANMERELHARLMEPDSGMRRPREEVLNELGQKAASLGGGGPGTPDAGSANEETDTDRTAHTYAVTVGVTTESGNLGALQFDVRYTGSSGGWLGAGGSAVCTADIQVALATFNDRGGSWLSAAMVDLTGFDTPGPVATCTFKSRETVNPGNFSVQVIDASGADVNAPKPDPFPQMSVFNAEMLD